MATTNTTVNHRAFKANLSVTYGLLSFTADLIPPRTANDEIEYKSACPTCHSEDPEADAVSLGMRYQCPNNADHGPFGAAEVLKATKHGSAVRVVGTTAEVSAVRHLAEDETNDNLVLSPFWAQEVEEHTYPIGTAYVLRGKSPALSLFIRIVGNDGRIKVGRKRPLCLIGEVTLRGNRKLFRLQTWQDQLVLQELVRPEALKTFASSAKPVDERLLEPIRSLLVVQAERFDPAAFADQQQARLKEFNDARLADRQNVVPIPRKAEAASGTEDLMAALEASLAAAKGDRTQRKAG